MDTDIENLETSCPRSTFESIADEAPDARSSAPEAQAIRVRVFVNFWNFHLALRDHARAAGLARPPAIDWERLGPWLAGHVEDALVASHAPPRGTVTCAGVHVYASHNPASKSDDGVRALVARIGGIPGVRVLLKERSHRRAPRCPCCRGEIARCPDPECSAPMAGTMEKGIDTAIVTDMLGLALDDATDVTVLLSADADFIPAVTMLRARGHVVLQGGFPPLRTKLARACVASLDLSSALEDLACE